MGRHGGNAGVSSAVVAASACAELFDKGAGADLGGTTAVKWQRCLRGCGPLPAPSAGEIEKFAFDAFIISSLQWYHKRRLRADFQPVSHAVLAPGSEAIWAVLHLF